MPKFSFDEEENVEYRPEIDGLRAVAVFAVLLFHLDPQFAPGGFAGVDVFFVLSGYLITSVIVSERQQQSFDLARFYQRRVARIMPQLFLVVAAVLVMSSLLYTPQDFASVGAVSASAVFAVSNLKFLAQGNYFALSPDAQPLLHTWSLGVEEQFYLIFPVLVMLTDRGRHRRSVPLAMLLIAAVVSFSACWVATKRAPTSAFYLMPCRAWELLVGSCLALSKSQWLNAAIRLPTWLGDFGLAAVVASFIVLDENSSFPGPTALLPVIGTAFAIGGSFAAPSFGTKLLSARALVGAGKMSYALYLWHWPVFSLVDYSLYERPGIERFVLKIILTFGLSGVSYLWVERPARRRLNDVRRPAQAFVAAFGIAIVIATLGVGIRRSNYVAADASKVRNGGETFNDELVGPSVALMGDSNAAMYGVLVRDIAREMRMRANILAVPAGNPVPDAPLYKDSLSFLADHRPDVTIFVASWPDKFGGQRSALERALQDILEVTGHVILVSKPPVLPSGGTRNAIRAGGSAHLFEDESKSKERMQLNKLLFDLSGPRVKVIDTDSIFHNPDGSIRFSDERGRLLWHDFDHLSHYGAELLKAPLIDAIAKIRRARQGTDSIGH